MNTIPLIFNERHIERTVLGGKNISTEVYALDAKLPCSLILLNRGSNHYRQQNIDNLLKIGFAEIISVETTRLNYNLEDFSLRHPQIKFIVPQEKLTIGDMINIGMSECSMNYALVIWNDIHIGSTIFNQSLFEKLAADQMLCVAPFLQSSTLQTLPIGMSPTIEKGHFTVTPTLPLRDREKTVYPFDFMGLYNRQKFEQLGGFDYTITNPYWQNLDFSLRAWLWGEEIRIASQFKLRYEEEIPLEDSTADITQLRFFLKNCAPSFCNDYSYIPISKFFMFCKQYPDTPFEALKVFKDARTWVKTNRYRFKTDVIRFTTDWNSLFESTLTAGDS